MMVNEHSDFIEVELNDELSEILRLFCEAAGNESRDEVIAAAIVTYFRAAAGGERASRSVVPLRSV